MVEHVDALKDPGFALPWAPHAAVQHIRYGALPVAGSGGLMIGIGDASLFCGMVDPKNFMVELEGLAAVGLTYDDIEFSYNTETVTTQTLPTTYALIDTDYPNSGPHPALQDFQDGSVEVVRSFTCSRPFMEGDDPIRGRTAA